MEAWMAFVSIMAIVAIVVVAGGLIAFIGHMILGAFDNGKQGIKKESKDVIDYAQYKQLTGGNQLTQNKEYDFQAINESKAQKEKEMLENEKDTIFDIDDKDEELEEIENRIKANKEVEHEEVKEDKTDDDVDDFDLDSMLDEISNDIIEEEKAQSTNEEVKMSDELSSYSIDDLLKQVEDDDDIIEDEEVEEAPVVEETPVVEEVPVVEEATIVEELKTEEMEEVQTETTEEISTEEIEELIEEVDEIPVVEETSVVEEEQVDERDAEIEALKAQLKELNKQLEEARTVKTETVEVIKIDTTEEECLARLETLEERLKAVKKDYKINAKEYRPLKKVMNDLERYQTKLRRKEAVVAKKKVALYGVNNYVDIDKEKAEKLANELELLDGLRLSVNHCEEVINANKDRFPVLEHTNQILEDQISHIEADIESTKATLQKIRDQKDGEDENK